MMKPAYLVVALALFAACSGSSNSGRPCAQDGDCNLGEVCANELCAEGCRSGRDCPPERALCDTSAGSNGACVECIDEADCGDGRTCLAGKCRKTCASDLDCGGQKCDLDAKICVDCLDSSDCALGNLCIDKTCAPGCERDRDCPDETPKCDPDAGDHGTCFQCLTNAQCGANQKCQSDHVCHDICTSNAQCVFGVCDIPNEVCVDCLDKADCPLGEICEAKACVIGCEEDRDCPTSTPVCDPGTGTNGTCFQCLSNSDCGANGMCVDHECKGDPGAMINIPAGSFVMGAGADTAETRRHTVTLGAFSIDANEVTNMRYKNCVDDGGCLLPSTTTDYNDPAKAQHPVTFVTWQKAQAFCAWAGKRLPTEAEWERAARGTDERTYPWGAATPTCALTNGGVGGTGADPCVNDTTAVNTHPTGASPVGASDMAGNAREWVNDWYAAYPPGNATDPQGPATGTDKIARGGSYVSAAADLSTHVRPVRAPSSSDDFIGFRCAKGGSGSIPSFTVTPGSGPPSTVFAVNASATTDPNYPTNQLQVRWDWQDDGTYDTAFTTTKTASHGYATAGNYTIRVEVKNPANVTRTTTRAVMVTGNGGQGSPCNAPSECMTGYTCLVGNTCAELCPNAVCTVPNTTCGPAFEIGGVGFTLACQ